FNCFDTTILLADGWMKVGLQPDQKFGPFRFSVLMTDGTETMETGDTAREAFTKLYGSWYRDATEAVIPESMKNSRMCLTAVLFGSLTLPRSSGDLTIGTDVMTALKANWQRAGLQFPKRFEVVLLHVLDLQKHVVSTSH